MNWLKDHCEECNAFKTIFSKLMCKCAIVFLLTLSAAMPASMLLLTTKYVLGF